MLARRFALPPVHEPKYEPRQIPNACGRDLSLSSVIVKPPRELWLTLLGEMVVMVNEAVRRRASSARDASKPLSLEYMADRLDVDDPLLGYMVLSREEGWLQGFATCTTFTTWHRNFRWDSLNPALDLRDHNDLAAIDEDGSLAVELQAQLHAGDPDDEGVVWPRIAELSLLGALGCGRWLVQLIIEECEAEDSPYEYIIAQATDGSIPFYERMGFVRVGAVTIRKREDKGEGEGEDDGEWRPKGKHARGGKAGGGTKRKAKAPPANCEPVASAHVTHRVEQGDETLGELATRLGVPLFDLIFLNAARIPKLSEDTVLKKDTRLLIPVTRSLREVREESARMHHEWYVVPDDMPFKECAKELGIEPKELIRRNLGRPELKGLQVSSELLRGTRLQIRHVEYESDEYCHWTFPDDNPEHAEPSYMMARRLTPHSKRRPPEPDSIIERSKKIMLDERPPVRPSGKRAAFIQAIEDAKAAAEQRKATIAASAWHQVKEDRPFKKEAEALGLDPRYLRDLNASRLKGLQLSAWLKKDTWLQVKPLDEVEEAPVVEAPPPPQLHMVNRVVQIDGEDAPYEYWYVLTYLPDLQWCRVAPLEQRGFFTKPSPDGHVADGRPRWMLVPEDQGGEIDVGAGRCHIMESYEMIKTKANADTEEWDILGRAPPGWVEEQCELINKKKTKKKGPGEDSSADPLAAAAGVLEQILKQKNAKIFAEPVDWRGLGLHDYPQIVEHPMDIGTVQRKLREGKYNSSLDAVVDDVQLVWANAMLYNRNGSPIYRLAATLKAFADKKFEPIQAAAAKREAKAEAATLCTLKAFADKKFEPIQAAAAKREAEAEAATLRRAEGTPSSSAAVSDVST